MSGTVVARLAALEEAELPVAAALAPLGALAPLVALPPRSARGRLVAVALAPLVAIALVVPALVAQQAAPQQAAPQPAPSTSITLYQDGRIFVRRAYPVRIPAGSSVQHLTLGPVDPSTLVSLDSDVAITGATTTPAVDAEAALRAMVGQPILFRSGTMLRDTVRATLVSMEPVRVRLADGSIYFGLPGTPTFPAEPATGESSTDVRLQARRGSDRFRVGGFAQGGAWNAMYAIVLRGSTAQVTGLASFATPLTAEDAEVQLLAGQVNQAQNAMPMYRQNALAARAPAMEDASGVAGQQKVGEFHLYTLPGRQDLRPGTMSSVALFDPATAPVVKSFEVGSSVPFYGYWPENADQGEVPVQVYYTLTRARRTPFGDAPLPAGAARLFEADSAGRLQLVGEAGVGHTAPGEELRIAAGTAFDLVAKRIQTDWAQGQEPVPSAPRRTRTFVNAAYADTLRNQGDSDATIDVQVERGGEWRILESSLPAERLSSTRARFRVKVPARGQAVVTYRIKATW
ncbi:MAG TPA: hypothetical protein VFI13_13335 [Gemmatimonadales bacterium]|nr:hypothetical protein [Gemmatimonadales bacterium]